MSNIATTIEQSRHLLELGLDPKTADMCWEMEKGNWILNVGRKSAQVNRGFAIPAWSVSALLEVIKGVFAYTTIAISGASKGFNFIRCKDLNYIWTHDVNADSPIGAAYEMVCLLLKQGLIKKGGEQ